MIQTYRFTMKRPSAQSIRWSICLGHSSSSTLDDEDDRITSKILSANNDSYIDAPVIQHGDTIELEAQYRAPLLGFRPLVIWSPNVTDAQPSYGPTYTMSINNGYHSGSVSVKVVYRLFNAVIRSSEWYHWQLSNATYQDSSATPSSTNYVFYQDHVVRVPQRCMAQLGSGNITRQAVIDISSTNCTQLSKMNITVGTIIMSSGTLYNIQNPVITATNNITHIIIILNSTYALPMDVLQDASFTSVPFALSMLDNSSQTQSNKMAMRMDSKAALQDPTTVYSFNTGNQAMTFISGLDITFIISGSVTLNPTVTIKVAAGALSTYKVEWAPTIHLDVKGTIRFAKAVPLHHTFTLWSASGLGGIGLFGMPMVLRPTFSFPLTISAKSAAVWSGDLIGQVEMTGSFSADYNPSINYWSNPTIDYTPSVNKRVQFIPSTVTSCMTDVSIDLGIELGLKMWEVLSVSITRSVAFAYLYQTGGPTESPSNGLASPDSNIGSNALCNKDGCYCPCLNIGDPIGAFEGANINTGWTFSVNLAFWKVFSVDIYTNRFSQDHYYPVGPQVCSARKPECASIVPRRCTSKNCPSCYRCTSDLCYYCKDPSAMDCGGPPTTQVDLYCVQQIDNSDIVPAVPVPKPPGYTCNVRCCGKTNVCREGSCWPYSSRHQLLQQQQLGDGEDAFSPYEESQFLFSAA
ncbi:hypothetical protein SAMD00019534_098740 [Acytostelium subglobosum LB1]|uniref:hypothetical protein n=1 Tax=Acytostelium subglobosum LB1 TaxID=1410327 RepID=UPI000644EE05|nr:hypothetical protein SAMD00019534_098740 [Acytostelium subglobosum LB1]GAM26699.1 hypothetical protein SAMD00019534_098740 [Acytostelium subglobosum LB1]|eukprot:XP_012750360.1 hypothetical protein SAMD00019534_098740 [Acytostelium subglobosum LB1]